MPTRIGAALPKWEPARQQVPAPTPQDAVDNGLDELTRGSARRPHPTGEAPQRAERSRASTVLRFAAPIVTLTLGMKALILWLGVVVSETLSDRAFTSFSDRLTPWTRWDAPHYLDLAEYGYRTTGDPANFIVFFPGYPSAVWLASAVTPGDLVVAGFVVSAIASIAAALLLAFLARRDGADDAQATRAAWFLLIFPTAYFLHIPYTESLFLALVLGSIYAARTGHWATAGIVGMLAAATRLNGVFLFPVLAIEALLLLRTTRRIDPAWLWLLLIPAGLAVYLGINQYVFGDPLHFQEVQREHWLKSLSNPITSVTNMIDGASGRKPGDVQMLIVQEVAFLGIGLAAGLAALVWSRPSYAAWVLLNVVLFASTSWIQSTPRYAITLFPIFLLLARAGRRPWVGMLISAWSLMMLTWFATKFALGQWAF